MTKKKAINVSMAADVYQKISLQAEKESRSISNMLEYTAKLYIENIEKQKKASQ